ncbi:hypothetical protein OS493_022095 [Desmophyllum pertusum]|uniref:Uncharacterized protein n=1 Tax=Desmophyllum pertusum TaxID=174260 RepID=A0A9X0CK12_9CNID|nr:hypothetical protein OS493_022095 [Desmophyllum pertusum]
MMNLPCCDHTCHTRCLDRWFRSLIPASSNCPHCREEFDPEIDDEDEMANENFMAIIQEVYTQLRNHQARKKRQQLQLRNHQARKKRQQLQETNALIIRNTLNTGVKSRKLKVEVKVKSEEEVKSKLVELWKNAAAMKQPKLDEVVESRDQLMEKSCKPVRVNVLIQIH